MDKRKDLVIISSLGVMGMLGGLAVSMIGIVEGLSSVMIGISLMIVYTIFFKEKYETNKRTKE